MERPSRSGSRVASHRRRNGAVLSMCLVLSGCLVTDEIEFKQEENIPPVILDAPGSVPIGSFIQLDLDMRTPPELRLQVRVRDDNLRDELQARHRVVTNEGATEHVPGEILPSGEAIRDYGFAISGGDFMPRTCQRVELVVSKEFSTRRGVPFDFTTDPDDLARASWWVMEISNEVLSDPAKAQHLLDSCPIEEVPETEGVIMTEQP